MLPQIVRTLINWFPGKSEQNCSMVLMATSSTKNCRGFRDRHLTDFFVPQRLAPESSDLLSQSMIQAKESTGSLEIGDVLAAMPTDPAARCIAVIGSPGSGKTSLLEYLQRIYAENRHKQIHSGMPNLIPMGLCVRDIRSMITGDRPPSLGELIAPGEPPGKRQRFESHLKSGDYLVMLDGLNEVDSSTDRQRIVDWIDHQMQTYLNTPFIVTSRSGAYHLTPLQQVTMVLELQPFNDRQIQQFLQHWYQLNNANLSEEMKTLNQTANYRTAQLLAEIKSVRAVANMASNPLLLKAIAQVYDNRGKIPTRRVELYGSLCDVQLTDKSPTISNHHQILPAKKSVLQKLALSLMEQKTSQFTGDTWSQLLRENVELFANPNNFGGLLVETKPEVYEFAHQSFQEYLAAVEIKHSQQEALLIENLQNHWWHETIKFYTEITGNTGVIQAALSEATTLNLAYDCLQNNLNVPSALQEEFNQKLAAGLEADQPIIFQSAAKVLLKQRCQKLLNSESSVAIDSDYITNAEYQLFIDDKRKVGQSRQPDHWLTNRFATGEATEAIAGVRGSDAEEFCEWLTQQYAVYGIRFRLPTLAEVETQPASSDRLGAWCYAQKDKAIAGLSPQLWQQSQKQIAICLERDLDLLRRRQNTLKLDLDRTLTRHLALTLARSQKDQLIEQLSQRLHQGKSHEMLKNLKHIHELVFCLGNVDNFNQIRDFAIRISKVRQLFAIRKVIRTPQSELAIMRIDLLLIYICFHGLKNYYLNLNNNAKLRPRKSIQVLPQSPNQIIYYEQKQNEALNLYAFFLLIESRNFQNFPAFEGIRVVKEQVE